MEAENVLRSEENGPSESIASLNFFILLMVHPSIDDKLGDG